MYQNESCPPADGAVNVCAMLESPFVGFVLPTRAAYAPLCPPATTDAVPADVVQPLKVPVSKPPLTIPLLAAVTVTETAVLCIAPLPLSIPVTVTV